MAVAAVRGEPVLLRELCPQGCSFAGGAGSGDGNEAGRLSRGTWGRFRQKWETEGGRDH